MDAIIAKKPWAWIVDHNPFYLLSTVCMLFGCYALQHAMNVQAGEFWKLGALLLSLNIYEALLIGLGYMLFVRHKLVRDTAYVLVAELLFLADATFLNGETVTTDLWVGGAINIVLLLLAVLKVWIVLRTIRVPNSGRVLAFVILELALLYIMPGFFRKIGPDGTVSAMAIYGMWWVVGALPFVRDAIFSGRAQAGDGMVETDSRFATGLAKAYMVVPYLSLLAHLWIMHWVYDAPFYWADITPVLLGLTLVTRRLRPMPFMGARDIATLRGTLLVAAVLFSLGNPEPLNLSIGMHIITPLLLAIMGAFLTGVYCFLARFQLLALAFGATAGTAFLFRQWMLRMGQATADTSWQAGTWTLRLMPHTVEAWGVVSMIAAFALLGVGAWVSMRRRHWLNTEHASP